MLILQSVDLNKFNQVNNMNKNSPEVVFELDGH